MYVFEHLQVNFATLTLPYFVLLVLSFQLSFFIFNLTCESKSPLFEIDY